MKLSSHVCVQQTPGAPVLDFYACSMEANAVFIQQEGKDLQRTQGKRSHSALNVEANIRLWNFRHKFNCLLHFQQQKMPSKRTNLKK